MSLHDTDSITTAIGTAFISPNEADANGEPANVVDGLFAIARAIGDLAGRLAKRDLGCPDCELFHAEGHPCGCACHALA